MIPNDSAIFVDLHAVNNPAAAISIRALAATAAVRVADAICFKQANGGLVGCTPVFLHAEQGEYIARHQHGQESELLQAIEVLLSCGVTHRIFSPKFELAEDELFSLLTGLIGHAQELAVDLGLGLYAPADNGGCQRFRSASGKPAALKQVSGTLPQCRGIQVDIILCVTGFKNPAYQAVERLTGSVAPITHACALAGILACSFLLVTLPFPA